MFFLVLENNPNVLKKDLFSVGILAVLVPLNLLTNLLCSLSASPNGKFRLCVSPEKQNVMQIYQIYVFLFLFYILDRLI